MAAGRMPSSGRPVGRGWPGLRDRLAGTACLGRRTAKDRGIGSQVRWGRRRSRRTAVTCMGTEANAGPPPERFFPLTVLLFSLGYASYFLSKLGFVFLAVPVLLALTPFAGAR